MMTKPKNQHLSISPTRRRGRLRTMQLNPVPSCMISLQLCSIVTFLLIIILISYNTYNANVLFLSDINASPKDSIIEKTKQQFLYEAANNGSTPHVAWLMSFPNSGTSYTMHLVRSLSNTTCATNYEKEANVKDTIPISGLSPHGPFLLKNDMIVPKRFILTKTHCAGYCNECPIGKYIINRFEFQQGCATNILTSTHIDAMNRNIHNAIYDYRIEPKRVIRLVRDPFDNVVSNFHHWLGKQATLGNGLDKDYTRDRKGFMDYCKGYNALFENKMKKEKEHTRTYLKHFFSEVEMLMPGVPCHQHFFRYINWHNNANFVTKDLPTLVIHYKDYENSFEETKEKIFDFLELDQVGINAHFKKGKSYRDYYTDEQIHDISTFIRKFSQPATLRLLSQYLQ